MLGFHKVAFDLGDARINNFRARDRLTAGLAKLLSGRDQDHRHQTLDLPVLVEPVNLVASDVDFRDLPFRHLIQELGKCNLLFLGSLTGADDGDQQHRDADQNHPEN